MPDLAAKDRAARGTGLTGSRAIGVELPTSGGPAKRRRQARIGLPASAKVTTPDAVLRSAARAAAESLGPITAATRQVAEAFRRRELGYAQANLGDLFRTLRTLTLVTSRLSTKGAPTPSGTPVTLYSRLMRLLDEFAERQRVEDWDGVARLLADDLESVLAEWPSTLRAFSDRQFDTDGVWPAGEARS